MKKIFVLLFVLLLLASSFSYRLVFDENFNIDNSAIYTFYILGSCDNIENSIVIKNGNSSVVKTKKTYASIVRKNLTNVLGESVSFKGDRLKFSKLKEKLSPNYVVDETLENGIVVYSGFSNELKENSKTINLDGREVNFQIAYNNGTITIGTPVILGDY